MTYAASTVSYWVGQANDSSTGNHPTGWTSGQRWSETAGEWQAMYDTQYSTARDTSTGTHPTGWTNGQLWSETASEWQAMHDTEYANARDNSGGQPNKPSGNAHPTGWTAGQLWSLTATQWNTMWGQQWDIARDTSAGQTGRPSGLAHPTGWTNQQLWSETATEWNAMWVTEWNAARDPQGFSYSYPGQAANAVYWSQSANYWKGQHDYWKTTVAHDDPSVWDNRYNAGYTAGDTAGRAAVSPPSNVDDATHYLETTISGSWSNIDGYPGVTWSLTLPVTGHWQISIEAYIIASAIGGGANGYVDVVATGPIAHSPTQYFRWGSTDQQVNGGYGKSAHGVYSSGTVQTWRIPGSWRTANGSVSGKIVAHFVPSITYPR